MTNPVKKKNERSEPKQSREVRIAFPFVHKRRKKTYNGAEKSSYSASLLFPKLHHDPQQCPNHQFLWGLACEAAMKMWPGSIKADGMWGWPDGALLAIKDGDNPVVPKPKPGVPAPTPEQAAQRNAWRKGSWVVEVTNNLEPGPRVAVMQSGQWLEIPTNVVNGQTMYKSGDYGIVSMDAWAYENEQFGINFGFEGVLFTRPGDPIGSSGPRSAAEMFGDMAPAAIPGATPPPAAYAPNPLGTPPGAVAYQAPQPAPAPAAPVPPAPPMPAAPPSPALPPFPGAR